MEWHEYLLECLDEVQMFVSSGMAIPDGFELIGVVERWPDGKPTDKTVEVWRDKSGFCLGRVFEDIDI